MMKKRVPLKSIINSIIAVIAVIAFVINSVSVYFTWKNICEIRERNVGVASNQLGNYLTQENEKLGRLQSGLNSMIRENKFFSLNNNKETERRKMSEYVYDMMSINDNLFYAMTADNDGNYCVITETMLSEEVAEIKKLTSKKCGQMSEDTYDGEKYEYFVIDKPNFRQMLYIFCCTPVYEYDYEKAKTYRAGRLVVCTKINTEKLLKEYEDWSNLDVSLQKGEKVFSVVKSQLSDTEKGFEIRPISINNSGWKINGTIYETDLENKLSELILLTLIGFMSTVVLMFVFRRILNQLINKPVKTIVDYLNRRADGDGTQHLAVNAGVELSAIADGINRMIKADYEKTKCIFMQQQRLYEYELQTREARLTNLQRQINPHFLYNSLECVRTLAMIHGADEVADIAVDLAEIMRYSLDTSETATLSDEVAVAKNYLSIMNARYPDRFSYNIDIPEDIMGCSIMKMILQPVIENAFKHGLRMTRSGNIIDIKAESPGRDICISIRDNGKGIAEDELEQLKKEMEGEYSGTGGKIGMLNVHHRLRLSYGEEYGIEISSRADEYTEVILKIPRDGEKKKFH